jgi:hypothetical protein
MKSPPIKSHWIDRAVDVHNFHAQQVKSESSWTIHKTAKALSRSLGSVSQDLLLASWLKTHEKVLRRFSNAKDALEFIRMKKKEMKTQDLEL